MTLRYVGAYDHYDNGVYYKTSAGLTEVPTDIPAEARQVQLYNNAIGNTYTYTKTTLQVASVLEEPSRRYCSKTNNKLIVPTPN